MEPPETKESLESVLTWIESPHQTMILEVIANTGKIQGHCNVELLQQSSRPNA